MDQADEPKGRRRRYRPRKKKNQDGDLLFQDNPSNAPPSSTGGTTKPFGAKEGINLKEEEKKGQKDVASNLPTLKPEHTNKNWRNVTKVNEPAVPTPLPPVPAPPSVPTSSGMAQSVSPKEQMEKKGEKDIVSNLPTLKPENTNKKWRNVNKTKKPPVPPPSSVLTSSSATQSASPKESPKPTGEKGEKDVVSNVPAMKQENTSRKWRNVSRYKNQTVPPRLPLVPPPPPVPPPSSVPTSSSATQSASSKESPKPMEKNSEKDIVSNLSTLKHENTNKNWRNVNKGKKPPVPPPPPSVPTPSSIPTSSGTIQNLSPKESPKPTEKKGEIDIASNLTTLKQENTDKKQTNVSKVEKPPVPTSSSAPTSSGTTQSTIPKEPLKPTGEKGEKNVSNVPAIKQENTSQKQGNVSSVNEPVIPTPPPPVPTPSSVPASSGSTQSASPREFPKPTEKKDEKDVSNVPAMKQENTSKQGNVSRFKKRTVPTGAPPVPTPSSVPTSSSTAQGASPKEPPKPTGEKGGKDVAHNVPAMKQENTSRKQGNTTQGASPKESPKLTEKKGEDVSNLTALKQENTSRKRGNASNANEPAIPTPLPPVHTPSSIPISSGTTQNASPKEPLKPTGEKGEKDVVSNVPAIPTPPPPVPTPSSVPTSSGTTQSARPKESPKSTGEKGEKDVGNLPALKQENTSKKRRNVSRVKKQTVPTRPPPVPPPPPPAPPPSSVPTSSSATQSASPTESPKPMERKGEKDVASNLTILKPENTNKKRRNGRKGKIPPVHAPSSVPISSGTTQSAIPKVSPKPIEKDGEKNIANVSKVENPPVPPPSSIPAISGAAQSASPKESPKLIGKKGEKDIVGSLPVLKPGNNGKEQENDSKVRNPPVPPPSSVPTFSGAAHRASPKESPKPMEKEGEKDIVGNLSVLKPENIDEKQINISTVKNPPIYTPPSVPTSSSTTQSLSPKESPKPTEEKGEKDVASNLATLKQENTDKKQTNVNKVEKSPVPTSSSVPTSSGATQSTSPMESPKPTEKKQGEESRNGKKADAPVVNQLKDIPEIVKELNTTQTKLNDTNNLAIDLPGVDSPVTPDLTDPPTPKLPISEHEGDMPTKSLEYTHSQAADISPTVSQEPTIEGYPLANWDQTDTNVDQIPPTHIYPIIHPTQSHGNQSYSTPQQSPFNCSYSNVIADYSTPIPSASEGRTLAPCCPELDRGPDIQQHMTTAGDTGNSASTVTPTTTSESLPQPNCFWNAADDMCHWYQQTQSIGVGQGLEQGGKHDANPLNMASYGPVFDNVLYENGLDPTMGNDKDTELLACLHAPNKIGILSPLVHWNIQRSLSTNFPPPFLYRVYDAYCISRFHPTYGFLSGCLLTSSPPTWFTFRDLAHFQYMLSKHADNRNRNVHTPFISMTDSIERAANDIRRRRQMSGSTVIFRNPLFAIISTHVLIDVCGMSVWKMDEMIERYGVVGVPTGTGVYKREWVCKDQIPRQAVVAWDLSIDNFGFF